MPIIFNELHSISPVTEAESVLPRTRLHFPVLDGLRGIAVVSVMMFHYCSPLYEQGTLFSKIIYKLTHFGWCGVDLFFVLSGFLITRILFDEKGARRYLQNFYVRRCLRIFPLYYGVLLFCLVLFPLCIPNVRPQTSTLHTCSLWFYFTNVEIVIHGWDQDGHMSHFWTLAVEEQFYIVWPFLVMLCTRRTLIWLGSFCVVLAFIVRVWYVCEGGNTLAAYMLTFCRIDSLMWGSIVALVSQDTHGIKIVGRLGRANLLIAGTVLVLVVAKLRYFSPARSLVVTVGFSALAAIFAGVIALAIRPDPGIVLGGIGRSIILKRIGKIAYGLYVFHYLITPLTNKMLLALQSRLPYLAAAFLYLVCSFLSAGLLAVGSWHCYEKHFLKLKDRLAPISQP